MKKSESVYEVVLPLTVAIVLHVVVPLIFAPRLILYEVTFELSC